MTTSATAPSLRNTRLDLGDTARFPFLGPAPAAENTPTDHDPNGNPVNSKDSKAAAASRFLAATQAVLDRLGELGPHRVLQLLDELPPLSAYQCAADAVR